MHHCCHQPRKILERIWESARLQENTQKSIEEGTQGRQIMLWQILDIISWCWRYARHVCICFLPQHQMILNGMAWRDEKERPVDNLRWQKNVSESLKRGRNSLLIHRFLHLDPEKATVCLCRSGGMKRSVCRNWNCSQYKRISWVYHCVRYWPCLQVQEQLFLCWNLSMWEGLPMIPAPSEWGDLCEHMTIATQNFQAHLATGQPSSQMLCPLTDRGCAIVHSDIVERAVSRSPQAQKKERSSVCHKFLKA